MKVLKNYNPKTIEDHRNEDRSLYEYKHARSLSKIVDEIRVAAGVFHVDTPERSGAGRPKSNPDTLVCGDREIRNVKELRSFLLLHFHLAWVKGEDPDGFDFVTLDDVFLHLLGTAERKVAA